MLRCGVATHVAFARRDTAHELWCWLPPVAVGRMLVWWWRRAMGSDDVWRARRAPRRSVLRASVRWCYGSCGCGVRQTNQIVLNRNDQALHEAYRREQPTKSNTADPLISENNRYQIFLVDLQRLHDCFRQTGLDG